MRPIRHAWEALPPFPRPPSSKRIAHWWGHQLRDLPDFPLLPSTRKIAAWWRRRRHEGFLPAFPQPGLKKIAQRTRQRAREPGGRSVLPDLPSPKAAITWFRERRARRKVAAWCIGAAVILIGAG